MNIYGIIVTLWCILKFKTIFSVKMFHAVINMTLKVNWIELQ